MDTPEECVAEFAANVVAQTNEIMRGNAGKGNLHATRYIEAFKRLREFGDSGRVALVPLMQSGPADVRCAAAAFLLRFRTREATEVLLELSRGKGLIAFEADECLKRWSEGAWSLDPP